MKIVFLGLSITSSWGNGHATTYRGLVRELVARGHDVLFLERDVPWYADNRDLARPPWGETELYAGVVDLQRFAARIRAADLVILGSYVPEGVAVARRLFKLAQGVVAFYDIDTPVTLEKLARGDEEYLAARDIPRFDLYLSFTGGPTLRRLERELGARRARALYCSVDGATHQPVAVDTRWDLGYLGTYSDDRQPALEQLLLEPARREPGRRFVVAGPLYPGGIVWPGNVQRVEHCAPPEHPAFFGAQRWTLNLTRAGMRRAGWSPSVRLFEAAACGVPMISDRWAGLETLFAPGEEIVLAESTDDVTRALGEIDETRRKEIAQRARARVLREHTAAHRALELERHARDAQSSIDKEEVHGPSARDRRRRIRWIAPV